MNSDPKLTREEVLVILSVEHRYFTEMKLGRKATDNELIDHWLQVRRSVAGRVYPSHTFEVTDEPTLFD